MECIELNCLCKHRQPCLSINSYTELSKAE